MEANGRTIGPQWIWAPIGTGESRIEIAVTLPDQIQELKGKKGQILVQSIKTNDSSGHRIPRQRASLSLLDESQVR